MIPPGRGKGKSGKGPGRGSYVGGLGVSVRLGRDCEGSAVMRESARNARLASVG